MRAGRARPQLRLTWTPGEARQQLCAPPRPQEERACGCAFALLLMWALPQAEARQQRYDQSAVGKAQRKVDAQIKQERQQAPDRRPDTAQDWLS